MTAWDNTTDFDAIRAAGRRGAVRGLTLASEFVLAESNTHVPIEEDTLERSGKATTDASSLRACVSYNTPYAVTQHEDMGLRHDPGRTAKYLENALTGGRETARRIVAQAVRTDLGT